MGPDFLDWLIKGRNYGRENMMEKEKLWQGKYDGKGETMARKVWWKRKDYGRENMMEKEKLCQGKYDGKTGTIAWKKKNEF